MHFIDDSQLITVEEVGVVEALFCDPLFAFSNGLSVVSYDMATLNLAFRSSMCLIL